MYEQRFYREQLRKNDLEYFQLTMKETDLLIGVDRVTAEIKDILKQKLADLRNDLEIYIGKNPLFEMSFKPIPVLPDAPSIVKRLAAAAERAGVGPMAGVAGCLAEMAGEELAKYSREVIVENGGDIYIRTGQTRNIGIYAGASKFTGKLALEIRPEETPLGVCTSSGTIGHSVSLGRAEACLVKCASCTLADAYASAIGNLVQTKADLPGILAMAQKLPDLSGVLLIVDNELGIWGNIKIKETGAL